jgi:hypothetical protein
MTRHFDRLIFAVYYHISILPAVHRTWAAREKTTKKTDGSAFFVRLIKCGRSAQTLRPFSFWWKGWSSVRPTEFSICIRFATDMGVRVPSLPPFRFRHFVAATASRWLLHVTAATTNCCSRFILFCVHGLLPNQSPEPTGVTAAFCPRSHGWFHIVVRPWLSFFR